jgi:hypothetical protein
LPELLIDPGRFPSDYPAVVLDPQAAEQALRVIDGVPAGSAVMPPECAPAPPGDAMAVLGGNSTTSSTMTVAVSRTGYPLAARRGQLSACPLFTVDMFGVVSTVGITLLAAPPVAADDSYAVEQTVSGASTQTTLTLVAQLGDVRVTASAMTPDGNQPNTDLLDGLFSNAVLKVRRNGQP